MQIEGTIIKILPLEQGVSKTSGNPWSKGTIVIETGGQFSKKVVLSNMKKAEELVALPIGGQFIFDIDVESREYQGKWYTNVNCFRWTPANAQPQTPPPPQAPQPVFAQSQAPQQANPYQHPQTYQGNPYPQAQQADDGIPF